MAILIKYEYVAPVTPKDRNINGDVLNSAGDRRNFANIFLRAKSKASVCISIILMGML